MIGPNLTLLARALGRRGDAAPPSPWAFVGAGAVTSITTGTTLVLPLHSPAQAGDFIVIQLSSASAFSAPQGTAIDAGAANARYLTAVGGETSLTFTLTSAQSASGIAVTFRPTSAGVRAASNSVTGNPAVVPTVAVSNLPSLITMTGNHNGNGAWVASLPADSVFVAASDGTASVRALYFAYKIQTTGGTTGALSLQAAPTTVRATIGVFRLT